MNFFYRSLIGAKARIIESTCYTYLNISDVITDETKNTIVIGKKIIPKKCIKLIVSYADKEYTIDGKQLLYRPEDRINKVIMNEKHRY